MGLDAAGIGGIELKLELDFFRTLPQRISGHNHDSRNSRHDLKR
jgi:hypothetical protein